MQFILDWKKELLDRLHLSHSVLLEDDALAIDINSSSSSGPGSIKNADQDHGYPGEFSPENTIDRKTLLEELAIVRAEGKTSMARNNFFHDQLVEHFKRKQMMRVYGEPNEEDPLKSRYLKKIWKYEELREELEAGEEEFKVEIEQLREDLLKKTEEADAAVEELLSEQRTAGAKAYANGKLLPAKEIQAMITRELGKMKDISKIRVRYARLRDSLVEKEVVFDAMNILTPNLDRKDYERLEAENFYYKQELRMKEEEGERLAKRRDRIFRQLRVIRCKRENLLRVIQTQRDNVEELNRRVVEISQQKQINREKVKEVKKYFERFESILGLSMYPEVHAKMKCCQERHKKWLEKVATIMTKIKNTDRYLKDTEPRYTSHQRKEAEDEGETVDDTSRPPQKSSRPPLGGGFLQAL